MAGGIRASNKPSYLIPLFANVMMCFAQALQVRSIPEQFRLTLVRLFMINNGGRFNSISVLAHFTKRLTPKLVISKSKPTSFAVPMTPRT